MTDEVTSCYDEVLYFRFQCRQECFYEFPELHRTTVAYIEIIILSLYGQSKIGINKWIRQCDYLQLHQISSESIPNLVQRIVGRII